jgi:hypothetical protein
MNELLLLLIEQEKKQDELWLKALLGEMSKAETPSGVELHAMTLKKVIREGRLFRFDFSPSIEGFERLLWSAEASGLLSGT